MKSGIIYSGINNIYRVKDLQGREYLCRIKGKTLGKSKAEEYNPLAVGDYVHFQPNEQEDDKGLILERLERKNQFIRLNQKRRSPQTIAVNMDLLLCFSSPKEPPFRPRFLDRVLIAAEKGGVEPIIVINKCDQEIDPEMEFRLEHYRKMGYGVHLCSAHEGTGLDELNQVLQGKTVAVFGQSGVGKSTLLNAIEPGINLRTAEISQKYNRGRHTTNYSLMVDRQGGGTIIDTPGIRQFFLWGIESQELGHWYRDFQPYSDSCEYRGCQHLQEPGCAVRRALEEEEIHHDRYESYVRTMEDLGRS